MLERIQNVLRNRKRDDQGFSLVELAVVIVIIGILVAVAIPIFNSMQANARTAAVQTGAANGAAMVASNIANEDAANTNLSSISNTDVTVALKTGSGTDLDDFCVVATYTGGTPTAEKGPGCTVAQPAS